MRPRPCSTAFPAPCTNCSSCRVNLYWASQHYEELAQIRQDQGLAAGESAPCATKITLPSTLKPGTYWLRAVADEFGP